MGQQRPLQAKTGTAFTSNLNMLVSSAPPPLCNIFIQIYENRFYPNPHCCIQKCEINSDSFCLFYGRCRPLQAERRHDAPQPKNPSPPPPHAPTPTPPFHSRFQALSSWRTSALFLGHGCQPGSPSNHSGFCCQRDGAGGGRIRRVFFVVVVVVVIYCGEK